MSVYKYKYELVDWLYNFLTNRGEKVTKSAISKKSKPQLKWLFHNLPDIYNDKDTNENNKM